MSVSIVTRPIVSGSSWNAAGNPIIYTLQRADFTVTQSNDNAGALQLQINGIDLTASFLNGHDLYFLGYPGVHFNVISSSFSAGNTLINTNTTYSGPASGTLVNNSIRTDYRIYVNFTNLSSVNILPVELTFSPDNTGLIRIDAQILKNYLTPDWASQVAINEIETGTSLPFYLKYAEFYDNTLGSYTVDSSNPIYAVIAAMQVGSVNGGNMLDYNLDDDTSKFLQKLQPSSAFKKMVAWRDYPFSISFLWSTSDTTIYRRSTQFDVSGTIIGVQTFDALVNSGINNVYRLSLPVLDPACKKVRVAITESTSSSSGAMLTEDLEIEIRDACGYNSDYEGVLVEKNPIHLFCKNSAGGDLWWNFEAFHEYQYTYSNGKKAKRIQLFASQLHPVQWEALQDFNTTGEVYRNNITELTSSVIKTSTRVGQQVYIISRDGSKKTGVIVIPNSESAFSKDNVSIFSVTIELPEVFQV